MVTENRGSMLTENGHASRLALGRLIAGDIEVSERAGLEAHVRSCPRCGSAFAAAREAAESFRVKHPTLESLAFGRPAAPAAPAAAGLWERLAGIFGGAGLKPAFAGFGVLALVAVVWMFQANPGGDLAVKGGAQFYLTVNGRQVSGPDLGCGPNDTLQLGIAAGQAVYYAVLYKDDEGELSHYMGGEGDGQKPLGSPNGENLPHSLILSGGWATEIIYCVWADKPFTLEQAKDFIKNTAATPVEGMRAQVFRLRNIRA